ncbi:unnamed protein product [Prunus armeniaca]|uniref:Dihydroorotase, mitochondrial n=1 Tax=Prunus armeniaca TaxID=36596 RepID=A0A6J5VFY9_PRUAR|nr:unnamed protein product [Prunus armeniaca]
MASSVSPSNWDSSKLFKFEEDWHLGAFGMIKSLVLPCKALKFPSAKFEGSNQLRHKGTKMELTITRPDDWHLHLRDGELLQAVVPHSASHFARGIVMPNLKPPITTTAAAVSYRESILKALPAGSDFTPLMTLYLTDTTNPNEIKLAKRSGVVYAVKLYPAGATTNSQDGVTDLFGKCLPVLEEMAQQNMPLLVHGEVTDADVDVFDREKVFIDTVLRPLIQRLPQLKVVMEHVTTKDAVKFVGSCKEGFVAATVTPQHLLLNRNSLFQGGLQPHNYCLPVLKREIHRQAIVSAVTSGSKRFFIGTDSAPHERRRKESSCGCAGIYSAPVALSLYAKVFEEAGALDKLESFVSFNGPDFYGLPRNTSKIKLSKTSFKGMRNMLNSISLHKQVVVENLTGSLFYVQVGNNATVADLKREIETQQKLPYDRMILILGADDHRLMMKDDGDDGVFAG